MKKIEEQYKKLDEIDHVLHRPGRYLGSITQHTSETWLFENNKAVLKENSYVPAFIKIFDEVISNSVDHSKRPEGKHLTTISVDIDQTTGSISIHDNGGIPVVKHSEYDQYIPEMIFELRSGSNFNDDSDHNVHLIGQNGEGAGLTNIMSKSFLVETSDGKNSFVQEHTNNSRDKTEPKIKKCKDNYTRITYTPEYYRFNMERLDDGNYAKLVKRVYDVAGCNPKLKIVLNGTQIKIKSFQDYIRMYTDDFVYDENEHWRVGVSKSDGSFTHVSFVNGSETSIGGNHISYIADQLAYKLRDYITKKHRIQIKPSEIKNHINLFIDCNIVKPRFSSQTKEDMITEVRNFGTSFDITDKFINTIVKSDIIQTILDWAQAKENALLQAELRKLNKNTDKLDPIRVPKFDDATEKNNRSKCMLFLTEGDSASKSILSARDPKYHAAYALKGKPLNVNGVDPKRLMDNEEFKNLLIITGLKLGVPVTDIKQLRFGKICILSDQDLDGTHINGLIINMLHTFWPELFKLGVIHRFITPLIKVYLKSETLNFYSDQEYQVWKTKNGNKKCIVKYFKGLGTSTSKDFKEYIAGMSKHLIKYEIEDQSDKDAIHLAFSKEYGRSNNRKEWMDILG